jgi:hypothetical protein
MHYIIQMICLILFSVLMTTRAVSDCINVSIMPGARSGQLTFHRNANGNRIIGLKSFSHSCTVNLTGTTAATHVMVSIYRKNITPTGFSSIPRISVTGAASVDIIETDSAFGVPVGAANFTFSGSNPVSLGPFTNSEIVHPIYGNDGRLTINVCVATNLVGK